MIIKLLKLNFSMWYQLQQSCNMAWNPNSNKHKANHGGYKQKPSQSQVNALLELYNVTNQMRRVMPVKQEQGAQLKIEF